MATNPIPGDCGFQTPVPRSSRKRLTSYASVTNFHSQKRRRMSMASTEAGKENEDISASLPAIQTDSPLDRFIPARPKMILPLQITPRTKRISKQFGFIDDRVLNFKEDNREEGSRTTLSNKSNDSDTIRLLRRTASLLFDWPSNSRPTSVTENLLKKRQCLVVLDSPDIQPNLDAYPISWSKENLIAVSCGRDVYYQNMNTKTVSHLCRSQLSPSIWAIEWSMWKQKSFLATGFEDGFLQIWDAARPSMLGANLVQTHSISDEARITALSWYNDILAVGSRDKAISLVDTRADGIRAKINLHKERVLGLKWSADGQYLASSDHSGSVYVWDTRAGKTLAELNHSRRSRMVHKAPVKALAWCSWKPELLATGSYSPEGKIRIWNTATFNAHCPEPTQSIPLNTSIYSLHWSSHCKELLSTHGASFTPILSRPSPHQLSRAQPRPPQVKAISSPLANSITVHDYPSGRRLLSLTNAHFSTVSHSCLGPDGECVFTVCPAEETIKMWQVWGKRPTPEKDKSAFDKHSIR